MSTAERARGGTSFDQSSMRSGRDRSYGMMESNGSSALDDFPDLESSDPPEHGGFTFASFRSRFTMMGGKDGAPTSKTIMEGAGDNTSPDQGDRASPDEADDAEACEGVAEPSPVDSVEVCASPAGVDAARVLVSSMVGPETAFLRSEALLKSPANNAESLNIDCELMQREFGAGAEIEFEITVKRSGGVGAGAGAVAQHTSGQSDGSKWTIWKTSKEIFNLHASVVRAVSPVLFLLGVYIEMVCWCCSSLLLVMPLHVVQS
jgi:hypothetical protein